MSEEEQNTRFEDIAERVSKRLQKERTKRQVSVGTLVGIVAAAVVAVPTLTGGGRLFFRVTDCPDRLDQMQVEQQKRDSKEDKFEENMDWRMYRVEKRLSIQTESPHQQQKDEQDQMDRTGATNNSYALVDTNHVAELK